MKDGFTLLEIMIVVVIISILVLIFTFPFQGHIGDTEARVQQLNSSLLETSIKEYKMDTDQFPFGPKIKIEISTESKKIIQSLLEQKQTGKNFNDIKDSFYTLDSKKLRSYVKGSLKDMERYFSSDLPEIEGLVFTYKTVQNKKKEQFSGSYTLIETKPCSSDPSTNSKIQLPKEGDGTDYNPFVITTIGELQSVKLSPKSTFILGNNIEACVTKNWNNNQGFEPIPLFQGSFSETNYSINNLYINRPGEDDIGLFSKVSSLSSAAVFLAFKNPNIIGHNNVGILAGRYEKGISINIKIENANVLGNENVGGAFGVLGDIAFGVSITGTVTGHKNVGGFAGSNTSGGVSRSFVRGEIVGDENVGSAFGRTEIFATLYYNYFSAKVSGSSGTDPIIGKKESHILSEDSFYNKDLLKSPSDYATGRTEAEMKLHSTYLNWDFDKVWAIDPKINDGFPYLK